MTAQGVVPRSANAQPRVPAGVHTGGRYTTVDRADSPVELDPPDSVEQDLDDVEAVPEVKVGDPRSPAARAVARDLAVLAGQRSFGATNWRVAATDDGTGYEPTLFVEGPGVPSASIDISLSDAGQALVALGRDEGVAPGGLEGHIDAGW